MMASGPMLFSMAVTPFTAEGAVDEKALRAILAPQIEAGIGIYLGSGGAGEGHALSRDEMLRVYRIGVEACRGKVPVYANPPEPRTAAAMVEACKLAVEAGVDVVQIYSMDAGHAMRPSFAEQERYFRDILSEVGHPVALSAHVHNGFLTPIPLMKKLCADYPNIVAINIMGTPISYLVELRDAVGPGVAIYVRLANMLESLMLGAQGSLSAEPNIIPRRCAQVLERYRAGDLQGCGEAMADVVRFATVVNRWAPSTARWLKMAMKVLDLPGGEGGLRRPYLMPPQADLDEMAKAFERLGVRDWEGYR